MKRRSRDLSIGQRLALGFGLFLLVVAVVVGLFYDWHLQASRAQAAYTDRIAPLRDGMHALERETYQAGITLRSVLNYASPRKARVFSEHVVQSRARFAALSSLPMEPDGRALYDQITPALNSYLQAAEELIARKMAGQPPVSREDETRLGELRETLMELTGRFGELQEEKGRNALASLATLRERISRGMVMTAVFSAIILVLLAWLTARSIHGPTRRLVRTAWALEAGDWKPALALAPPQGRDSRLVRDEMTKLAYAFGSAAVALERREHHLQELLQTVQAQNEELQAQNEEIQAQSGQLQVQHEEIQAQNEELIQQSEELRRHAASLAEADDRKNKFLGVLAHELRNPMAPIANSIFILKRSPPGSEGAQRAQAIIERQARHLVRLIDDLLDVTRITEGKIHIQRDRLDLVDVVRSCVEDLAAALEQSGITLDLDLPTVPVEVNGDRTRLCQILGNLLNNCIKFCERGQVKIALRVDRANAMASLRVIDNGIGMDAELLPNLFQPFSQGATSIARTNGGLGLGLALVKALVTLHGGTVEAHSDGAGRGSAFTIRLPLTAEENARQLQRGDAPAGVRPAAAINRLLIIEDNVDAARSLKEALELDHNEVAVAHSGPEGVEAARIFRPDVVLCDIGLPGLNGYEVARALRADPLTRSAILIALTGYASSPDKDKARAAGFDLHLAKPLEVSNLSSIVAGLR